MSDETLESITEYFLSQESKTHAKVFLIHRSKHKNVLEKFHASVVEIEDDLKSDFDEIVEKALSGVQKNYSRIKPFNNPEITNMYRTVKKTTFPELEGLFYELENQEELTPITSFKNMDQDKHMVYCFQFKTRNKRIFVFSTIEKYVIPENKQNIVAEFKAGQLKSKKDELAILNKEAFCIYYEDIQTLLMIKYSETKNLLGFQKIFKDKCIKILRDDLKNVISYDKANEEKILGNMGVNEFLVKMNNERLVETDKSHYERWNGVYEKQKFTDQRLSKIVLNEEGIPTVKNPRELGMVLYAANNDIMRGVIKPGEYALVLSKFILK